MLNALADPAVLLAPVTGTPGPVDASGMSDMVEAADPEGTPRQDSPSPPDGVSGEVPSRWRILAANDAWARLRPAHSPLNASSTAAAPDDDEYVARLQTLVALDEPASPDAAVDDAPRDAVARAVVAALDNIASQRHRRATTAMTFALANIANSADSIFDVSGRHAAAPVSGSARTHCLVEFSQVEHGDDATDAPETFLALAIHRLHPEGVSSAQARDPQPTTRASALQLQTLVDSSLSYIMIKDRDGRFLFVNKPFAAFANVAPEAMVGRSDFEFLPWDLAEFLREGDLRVLREKQPLVTEEMVDVHGETRWFLGVRTPLLGGDGEAEAVGVVATDITDRVRFERALSRSEARHRSLFERNETVMLLIDPEDGAVVDANPAAERFYGYDRDAMRRLSIFDLNAQPAQETRGRMAQVKAKGHGVFRFTHRTAAGELRHVEARSACVEVDGTQLLHSMIFDITDRLRAEDRLREERARLELALSSGRLGFFDWDVPSGDFRFNEAFAENLGYAPEELGDTFEAWRSRVHPEDLDNLLQKLDAHDAGETDQFEAEHRVQCKQGDWLWRHTVGRIIQRDEHGHMARVIGLQRDIHEQKTTALRLAESEARFRTMVEHMPFLVHAHGDDMEYVFWNRECERVSGYNVATMLQDPNASTRLYQDPDQLARARRAHERMDRSFELTIVTRSGERRHIAWTALGDECPVPGWRNWEVGVDVTDRRRAERELAQSERRHRSLLETLPSAIMELDSAGRVAFTNAACATLLGLPQEELLDAEAARFIAVPKDARTFRQTLASLADADASTAETRPTASKSRLVTQMRRADGAMRDVQISWRISHRITPTEPAQTPDETSPPSRETRVVVVISDITDQQTMFRDLQHEAALNQALARLTRVLTSPDATLETVAEAIYREALTLTRSPYGFVASIDPETQELVCHNLTAMMDHGLCTMEDQRIAFPCGADGLYNRLWGHCIDLRRAFYSNDAAAQMTDPLPAGHVPVNRFIAAPATYEGEVLGQIALANTSRDYTDDDLAAVQALAHLFALGLSRLRHEQALRRVLRDAEVANRAKSEFLANMSHEVRTPLNGVLGSLQLAQTTALTDEQSEYVETALDAGRSLLSLINDILDFSKIEAGRLELQSEPFSFRSLAAAVVEMFRRQYAERDFELVLDLDDALPPVLVADEGRIRQILVNLLGNACKFTTAGEVRLQVRTSPSPRKDFVVLAITVSDTGKGVAPDFLEHLFEPFTQEDSAYHRSHAGVGLGLSIVRRLVESMDGDIAVESAPDEGARFTVTLELPAPRESCGLEASFGLDEQGDPNATGADCRLGLRVLVVDDDEVNRRILEKAVRKLGCEALAADGGEAALQLLDKEHVDVALMDIRMPGMDGLEVTRRIRAKEQLADAPPLPVIAVTANAMKGDREACLEAGMDGYLAKPLELEALAELLRAVRLLRAPH